MQLKIDEEFKSLIPPLTAEEFSQLKSNIIKDGCRDALVIWNDTIIDGHNRYRICTENDIPFQTVDKQFESRFDAVEWIIRNQFGRRNIEVYVRAELVFKLEDAVKAKAKEKMVSTLKQNTANLNSEKREPINTDKELAKTAGVSADTIWKSRVIKNEGTEEIKDKLRKGEVSLNKAFREVRKPEEKEPPETKTCNTCHKEFLISEFYVSKTTGKIEGRCKECSKKSGQLNKILSGVPSEIRNIPDDELIGSLYDVDGVPEYTLEDLAEEVKGKVNEFNRVMRVIMESHSELLQSDADYMRLEAELKNVTIKLSKI